MLVAIVVALMLLGPFNLADSRLPDGIYGLQASHWQAGQPRDCSLCPEKLFVVVCDADRQVHLRGLQQLAALQADQRTGGPAWGSEQTEMYSCIGKRDFRLVRASGGYGAAYDEHDPRFRFDLSFKVIRENAVAQLVEVRFRDSRTDIDDALPLRHGERSSWRGIGGLQKTNRIDTWSRQLAVQRVALPA